MSRVSECGGSGVPALPSAPAHLAPYVEALGVDDAMHLFLALGGSVLYLPRRSSPRSFAARTIGAAQVDRLAEVFGHGHIKVPLARRWVAEVMRAKGEAQAEIARTIRVDVATVRRWFGPAKTEQLDLF